MKTRGMVLKTAVKMSVLLLLLVPILGAPFVEAPATGTVVGIESAEDVEAGSVFVLSTYLENAINTTGFGSDLIWDPSVLKLLEVIVSASAPAGTMLWGSKIDNDTGSLETAIANMNPPNYITVIEKTPILDLTFEAVGSPGDSTILNLENVELSDKFFDPYFPDIVTNGSISIYTPEIISISVDPSDIDFGKIYKGGSGTSSVTITNDGNVEVSVNATLSSEVPEGFYTSNFKLDDLAVSGWSISNLGLGASELVGLSLDIPFDTEPGFKTAILTFWAEIP